MLNLVIIKISRRDTKGLNVVVLRYKQALLESEEDGDDLSQRTISLIKCLMNRFRKGHNGSIEELTLLRELCFKFMEIPNIRFLFLKTAKLLSAQLM